MVLQVVAVIIALTIAGLLLRLRFLILVNDVNRSKCYSAFLFRFDEADSKAEPDGGPDKTSEAQGGTSVIEGSASTLVEWPAYLEVESTNHVVETSTNK
jgi:hypothetical protein